MSATTKAKKLDITIDGKPLKVLRDSFLLDAIERAGIEVPTLCHHKNLTPNGTCRLCMVEVEVRGKTRMVTACNYPVRGDIQVRTDTPGVKQHRKIVAEMLLGRWPRVPVIQQVAAQCGVTESRLRSELTDENPKACILCTHCVRACKEYIMQEIIDFAGRGTKRHLTMPFGEVDPLCVGCTSCAAVCPTGALVVVDELNHPQNPELIRAHGMRVNAEMARLVISKGADVNAKDRIDVTPLNCAARGQKNVVDILLASGANVDAKEKNGGTPLHRAAFRGHTEIVELLLAHGADVDAKNAHGLTPADEATRRKHLNVVRILKEHRAAESEK